MSHVPNHARHGVARLARWWVQHLPRFSFRIMAIIFFAGVILFTTRPPKATVGLQSATPAESVRSSFPSPIDAKPHIYSWVAERHLAKTNPLRDRIAAPEGFERMTLSAGSFGDWLRHLPTWPQDTAVTTARRTAVLKANDPGLAAVIALQPGTAKVLDAANMLIRLRAEYLWSSGQSGAIGFHFTSGHAASWSNWAGGARPIVQGRLVEFKKQAEQDESRENFCGYLETVFQYASAYSILDDTRPADDLSIAAGDIFLNPAPKKGYALMVLDVAHSTVSATPEVRILLGRGGTPAQTFHVLRGPDGSPWFAITQSAGIRISAKESLRLKDLRHWR